MSEIVTISISDGISTSGEIPDLTVSDRKLVIKNNRIEFGRVRNLLKGNEHKFVKVFVTKNSSPTTVAGVLSYLVKEEFKFSVVSQHDEPQEFKRFSLSEFVKVNGFDSKRYGEYVQIDTFDMFKGSNCNRFFIVKATDDNAVPVVVDRVGILRKIAIENEMKFTNKGYGDVIFESKIYSSLLTAKELGLNAQLSY